MTTKTAAKPAKVVHFLRKATFKKSGFILYRVQRDGSEPYDVTFANGKVTACVVTSTGETCKGWQFNHKCCHADYVQAREEQAAQALRNSVLNEDLQQHVEDDLRFNPWHGSNYGAERLSREEYCSEFQVYNQE